MTPTAPETTTDTITCDKTHAELIRLFRIYRHSNLNIRYYGCRAEKFERYIKWVNICAALLSATALSYLLGNFPGAKYVAAIATGLVSVAMAVAPLAGWTEKARECRSLHFSYMQLFAQVELVMAEIRRSEAITEEQTGAAKMVHEAFMRLDAIDEPEPDQVLIDCENKKVLDAFPSDYIWTNF